MSLGRYLSCAAGPSRINRLDGLLNGRSRAPLNLARRNLSFDAEKEAKEYEDWRSGSGQRFAHPEQGRRARWMGGTVPYASNPSFRPPVPLSNDVQDQINRDLLRWDQDLGSLSEKYGVSKARIHAIRKLKEVEAEFVRQSLPLQTAFQEGMESLLGCPKSNSSSKGYNEANNRAASQALAQQVNDISNQTELDEERRWEAGTGRRGVFGVPVERPGSEGAGPEGTTFEWRDEEEVVKRRMGGEVEAAPNENEIDPELLTPQTKSLRDRKVRIKGALPARFLPPGEGRSSYRFVDVSSQGIRQESQVAQKMKHRAKRAMRRKGDGQSGS